MHLFAILYTRYAFLKINFYVIKKKKNIMLLDFVNMLEEENEY